MEELEDEAESVARIMSEAVELGDMEVILIDSNGKNVYALTKQGEEKYLKGDFWS